MFEQLFTDYTLRTVALGSAMLGIVSGALGSFAVLRRQSLLGDAVAHASLPGIALAFLFTGSKAPLVLMLGATLAGWAATLLLLVVTERTRVKYDSALALTLAVFFGFGLVLLTYIQKQSGAGQAGLDTFLFGQAASLVEQDVIVMAVLGAVVLFIVALFWKEFQLLSFDPEFGRTLGLPMRVLDIGLTSLIVIAIVIGLQTVGVVLMSAMLIAPAAAARQWTDRLGIMVVLAAFFGLTAGVSGSIISSTARNLPTGPMIVICVSLLVALSFLLAPNRGLAWRAVRDWRNARRLRLDSVLLDLYVLAGQHEEREHPHSEAVLDAMHAGSRRTRPALKVLAERGLATHIEGAGWVLTSEGMARARELYRSRFRGDER